jgi:uncharacterized protein (DUF433 family)
MHITLGNEPVPITVDSDNVMRVGNTRVTLDTVIAAFRDGATAEEICGQYPALDLADVYAVIGYYLHHRAQIDAYLQERNKTAYKIRQNNEDEFNPAGVRERLLNRRKRQG